MIQMFCLLIVGLHGCNTSAGLPWGLRRQSVCLQRERPGFNPWLGRFPGEGNGNPLQYSCLENPMDGGAWCRLLSMGLQRVRHDCATSLHLVQSDLFTYLLFGLLCYMSFSLVAISGGNSLLQSSGFSLWSTGSRAHGAMIVAALGLSVFGP